MGQAQEDKRKKTSEVESPDDFSANQIWPSFDKSKSKTKQKNGKKSVSFQSPVESPVLPEIQKTLKKSFLQFPPQSNLQSNLNPLHQDQALPTPVPEVHLPDQVHPQSTDRRVDDRHHDQCAEAGSRPTTRSTPAPATKQATPANFLSASSITPRRL